MVWSVLVSLFRSRVSLEAALLEYGPGPCAESEVEFCKWLRSGRMKIQGFAKRVEGFQQLSPKSDRRPLSIADQGKCRPPSRQREGGYQERQRDGRNCQAEINVGRAVATENRSNAFTARARADGARGSP
jgi:hypothetical protein